MKMKMKMNEPQKELISPYDGLRKANLFEDTDLSKLSISEIVLSKVSAETALDYQILPIGIENDRLIIVTTPESNNILSQLYLEKIIGLPLRFKFATEENILNAISVHYAINAASARRKNNQPIIRRRIQTDVEEDEKDSVDISSPSSPLTQLVDDIIEEALKHNASDIHIAPVKNESWVLFRIDGSLVNFTKIFNINKREKGAVTNRFKVICIPAMEITIKNMPQGGSFFTEWNGEKIDCRVSTMPVIWGEKVVVRLHDAATDLQELETLGFSEDDYKTITKLGRLPSGLVIVSGPTGSGKTTTLFAILRRYDPTKENIITIEDPPEIKIEGVNQVALRKAEDERINLTYAKVLRDVLRQDPDVILVGETRDEETAEVTVEASLTGHVVFTTVHAKDSISTIDRMFSLGVDRTTLLNELTCIISQRLLPVLCSKCSEPYQLTEEDGYILSNEDMIYLSYGILKRPHNEGCPECGYKGYIGRTVVAEVLYFNNKLRAFLKKDKDPDEIVDFLRNNYGYLSMWEKGLKMVRESKVFYGDLITTIRKND